MLPKETVKKILDSNKCSTQMQAVMTVLKECEKLESWWTARNDDREVSKYLAFKENIIQRIFDTVEEL